jgi:hypothetical protein
VIGLLAGRQTYKPVPDESTGMTASNTSEKGIGLTVLFVVLALGGTLTMGLGAEDHLVAAGGFAVAVGAGSLAVAARHVYA